MIGIGIIDRDKHCLTSSKNYLNRFNNLKLEFCYTSINEYKENIKTINEPDVLLIDNKTVNLEEVEYLKKVYNRCKIILLSNELVQAEVVAAIKLGISAYLIKAGNVHELYDAITVVYTGGCLLGPHVAKIVMDIIKKEDSSSEWKELTKREQDFAQAVLNGLTYKQIAEKLYVTTSTVNFHLQNIYSKLNVKSRAEFVSKYYHQKN